MLEHSPHGAPPLVAAPRHLRRRRMHTEIPDALLVPGAEPVPLMEPSAEAWAEQAAATSDAPDQDTATPAAEAPDAAIADTEDQDTEDQEAAAQAAAIREKESQQVVRDALYRRKRRVAFLAVLFVAIAVPAIALALFFG